MDELLVSLVLGSFTLLFRTQIVQYLFTQRPEQWQDVEKRHGTGATKTIVTFLGICMIIAGIIFFLLDPYIK